MSGNDRGALTYCTYLTREPKRGSLLRAQMRFDAEHDFQKILAKCLYVLVTSDKLYPPTLAPAVMAKLKAAGVDATYSELDSPYGHDATTPDAARWAPALAEFIERICRVMK